MSSNLLHISCMTFVKSGFRLLIGAIPELKASRLIKNVATDVYLRVPELLHDSIHNFSVHQSVSVHSFHVGKAINFEDVFFCDLHFNLYGVVNIDQNRLQIAFYVINKSGYPELCNIV